MNNNKSFSSDPSSQSAQVSSSKSFSVWSFRIKMFEDYIRAIFFCCFWSGVTVFLSRCYNILFSLLSSSGSKSFGFSPAEISYIINDLCLYATFHDHDRFLYPFRDLFLKCAVAQIEHPKVYSWSQYASICLLQIIH